ncbi:hypothetical protein EIP91_003748, partial [Steccherinum ochraceum]
ETLESFRTNIATILTGSSPNSNKTQAEAVMREVTSAEEGQGVAKSMSALNMAKASETVWDDWLTQVSVEENVFVEGGDSEEDTLGPSLLLQQLEIFTENQIRYPTAFPQFLSRDLLPPLPRQDSFIADLDQWVAQVLTNLTGAKAIPIHEDDHMPVDVPIVPAPAVDSVVNNEDDRPNNVAFTTPADDSVHVAVVAATAAADDRVSSIAAAARVDPMPDRNHIAPLFHMWTTCTKIKRAQNTNEATERIVADNLLRYVFDDAEVALSSMDDCAFSVRLEETIALPRSNVSSVTADALVVASLPKAAVNTFVEKKLSLRLSLVALRLKYNPPKARQLHYIGVFAVEDKCQDKEAANRQVIMDLSAIQRHRKALSLQNRLVYGAVYLDARFSLFVSWWTDHESIAVASVPGHVWDLSTPRGIVQCGYYLFNLKERLRAEIVTDFSKLDVEHLFTEEGLKEWSDWRRGPSVSTKSRSNPSTAGPSSLGHSHDEEANGEEESVVSSNEELPTPELSNLSRIVDHARTVLKVEMWRDSVTDGPVAEGMETDRKEADGREGKGKGA